MIIEDEIKVERESPRENIRMEYCLGGIVHPYIETSVDFVENQPVIFNIFQTNNNKLMSVSKNSSGVFTQINLKGGRTYRLSGNLCLLTGGTSYFYRTYNWFNVTSSKYVGIPSCSAAYNNPLILNSSGESKAYVELKEDATFELRCLSIINNFSTPPVYFLTGTGFEIQSFQNMKV